MLICGAHISTSNPDSYRGACKYALEIGGNCVQIFLKSPKVYSKQFNASALEQCAEFIKETGIVVFNHSPYMLNFSRGTDDNISTRSRKSLTEDIMGCHKIGAVGTVIHMGKHLKLGEETGIGNMHLNLQLVIDENRDILNSTKIILETSANQGTEICWQLEKLTDLYNTFSDEDKSTLMFCVDTAHIWAAGYNISTRENVIDYFMKFDKLIGLNKLAVIHFNDSKVECGSKKDRHQSLTLGNIGQKGLSAIVDLAIENSIPLVLETAGPYDVEINMINAWARGEKALMKIAFKAT